MVNKNNVDDFIITLTGNKCDLEKQQWEVSDDQVKGVADSLGLEPGRVII
jgi:GTPase SAR1 family protein